MQRIRGVSRFGLLLLLLVPLVLFACSGGDDDGGGGSSGEPTELNGSGGEDTTPTAAEGDATGGGSITGPIVFVSGLGYYAVDRESGASRKLEFPDGAQGAAEVRAASGEGAVFVLTFERIEGQSFSSHVYIDAIDLATGETSRAASLGTDRESDDAAELTEFDEFAASGGGLFIVRSTFGESEAEILQSGGTVDEALPVLPVSSPQGLVSDGDLLYFFDNRGLNLLDPETGTASVVLPPDGEIGEWVADADLAALFATRDGSELTADDLDFAAGLAIDLGSAGKGLAGAARIVALGGGRAWIQWSSVASTVNGLSYLGEATLGLDPATGSIDVVVPTAQLGTMFLDDNTISVGNGDMQWHNDALWVVDPQSNGAILRIDPEAGTAEIVYEPCSAEQICTGRDTVVFNGTDPDGLWIEVTRFEQQADGSRLGEIFVERLDSTTGELVLSIPVEQIYTQAQ